MAARLDTADWGDQLGSVAETSPLVAGEEKQLNRPGQFPGSIVFTFVSRKY